MPRAVLVWSDGHRLVSKPVLEPGTTTIGRQKGSDVDLSDESGPSTYQTVSRRHAEIADAGGKFVLKHLDTARNPTRVNGSQVPTDGPRALSDGDVIQVGELHLKFYDLAAADRVGGVVCPSCGRENQAGRKDCWYDGTNLANAFSQVRPVHRAVCRLAAVDGESFDLSEGEMVAFGLDGHLKKQPVEGARGEMAAAVEVTGLAPSLTRVQAGSGAMVNGQAAHDSQKLNNGDALRVGTRDFILIVR
jgi:pSer/pThr/pTyr-binding forkhead associated (FHA) protein